MAEQSRAGTYAVTVVAYQRRSLFQVSQNAEIFLEILARHRAAGKYKLHAFVVMPDHGHLLLSPTGIALEQAVALIKGGFSYRMKSPVPVWQERYHDHRCRDAEDFLAQKRYIHLNPVRAGMVAEEHLYRYSSAYRRIDCLSG